MVESMNDPSRSCGAALCGTCESKVAGAAANPLRKLLAVIWASIGIDVLACLIDVIDVREYYEIGRFMSAVNGFCTIALSAWLAIGITNRKNWARVTFIVLGLLYLSGYLTGTFLCCLGFGLEQGGGNAWVPFLDMADAALTVYCVVMLFTKKVRDCFFKSTNGKKWAWAFGGMYFVLCFVYIVMLGFSEDYQLSDEYHRDLAKAAEHGDAEAQYKLGVCYYDGSGVPKDMAAAAEWWRKAAEQGYAEAQYKLGVCYYNGEGVSKDMAAAAEWYRKAAEHGFVEAQCKLGVCYYDGKGVDKDMKEAAKWWYKAAERGLAEAQYKLGVCYYNGEGIGKDLKEAILWLERAKEQGNQDAIDLLAKIESK